MDHMNICKKLPSSMNNIIMTENDDHCEIWLDNDNGERFDRFDRRSLFLRLAAAVYDFDL